MSLSSKTLKEFKSNMRDLADQQRGIHSRRKQLFDVLVAECGNDVEARRAARTVFYEIEVEAYRKQVADDLEFLLTDEEVIDDESDDSTDGTGTD